MKFLFSLFKKKKEVVVQQRSVHSDSTNYVNLNYKDFELALRYAKGQISIATLGDELNLSKKGSSRYAKAYTFISNCFKKMIRDGILIEQYQVKKEVDFDDKSKKRRSVGQVAVWKPEAISILGAKKTTKSPTKFMRRKYPNLINYLNPKQ